MFQRVAIINRGEAAMRLIHAVRDHNAVHADREPLTTIALYTDVERSAMFVREADEARALGPASARPYLDHDLLARVLTEVRADAVWVGWGFVAEDAAFADRMADLGITFIGPSGDAMRQLGDKIGSKLLAEEVGVPVAPWSRGGLDTLEAALAAAQEVGYPLMLKATAGGGGRGIRRVESDAELAEAYQRTRDEAQRAFGSGVVFLEKLVTGARHVEVQLIADAHGTAWALGVRDCTIQRRNQKVIEESASPLLGPDDVADLKASAERLALRVGYVGAATVEFLYNPVERRFSFLEVNTRLQVEHPITEATTAFDLVKAQLHVAAGGALADLTDGGRPTESGHAIEARLNAEDPDRDFAPAPGRIERLDLPAGPGVRVDTGVAEGDTIPADFDSMIAKIIVHGRTRAEALGRLRRAMGDTSVVIEGGATNKSFVLALLDAPEVVGAEGVAWADTGWIDRARADGGLVADTHAGVALVVAAIEAYEESVALETERLFETARGGRPQTQHDGVVKTDLKLRGVGYATATYATGPGRYRVCVGDECALVEFNRLDDVHARVRVNGITHRVVSAVHGPVHMVEVDEVAHRVTQDSGGVLRSPAPALVVATPVAAGDEVAAGDPVMVLESMKMETVLPAPFAARVKEVLVTGGSQVESAAPLVRLEPLGDVDEAGASGGTLELPEAAQDDAPVARADRLRAELSAQLMGYDALPGRATLADYLAARDEVRAAGGDVLGAEIDLVALFADLAELARNRPFDRQSRTELRVHSDREHLHRYLTTLDAERAGLPPTFVERLERALRHYGIDSLDRTPELERAVFRLALAQKQLGGDVQIILGILDRWIHEPAPDADRVATARAHLERIVRATQLRFPAIGDLARSVRFQWYDQPQVDAELAPAADLEELDAWRLAAFDTTRLPAPDDVLLLECVAKANPADRRLVAIARVDQLAVIRDDDGRLLSLPHAERAVERCLEAIRRTRGTRGRAGSSLDMNHVWVHVRPPLDLPLDEIASLRHRITPLSDGAGIEEVLCEGTIDQDGQPRAVAVRFRARAGAGVVAEMIPPVTQPLQPLDDYASRVLRARRRGLVYPYELAPVLAGEGGEVVELDLDASGRLVPAEREPGRNTAGIICARVTTRTPMHPDGVTRIVLSGDPTRGLGAVAEPECARIIAAIDLAEELGVPVEWFTVSSGARIAMDSGTENMDWVAAALRRIVTFTQAGGEINVVVAGINVGAQPYWNAEATMLMHTRGILVMTPDSAMVLTGKQSLDFSGGVSAEDNFGIGGYDRVMGPNGQAQYWAPDLEGALRILLQHYDDTYVVPGEDGPRRVPTEDPTDRDVSDFPHASPGSDFTTVGQIFSVEHNPDRKKAFDIRTVIEAVCDTDHPRTERWAGMADAETAVVVDARLGGHAVSVLGIESKPVKRAGFPPTDGPDTFTAGTLFPRSSKKAARAINAASGNRPLVVLANLSGFDGSPESMRNLQLEYGAEIGRAIVNFQGPIVFVVISRYHGGAFVVFSKRLNPAMTVLAIEGSHASVIGGAPAAAVVFAGDVKKRTGSDPRVAALEARLADAEPSDRAALQVELADVRAAVRSEKISEVAAEFDRVHTIHRAVEVGSVDRVIQASELRPAIIEVLDAARP